MRTIRRTQAIDDLRAVLLDMVDAQNSLCRVASWRGVFCRGFAQWSRPELERRFPALERKPAFARGHLEQAANRCQLARQDIRASKLPCDVAPGDEAPCHGWQEFDEHDLARFYRELRGEVVRVVPDAPPVS